jgi:hypothetical protein
MIIISFISALFFHLHGQDIVNHYLKHLWNNFLHLYENYYMLKIMHS